MKRFRLHSLGIPHTITSKEYLPCAFTQKVYNGTNMFTDIGHITFHYGNEASTVRCTENVPVTTVDDLKKTYGDIDYWKTKAFDHRSDNHVAQEFKKNTITELRKRIQPNDFLLCWWGLGHKEIADAVADLNLIIVEPGIGYPATFAPFRVFESYAKLHFTKGQIDARYHIYHKYKDSVPAIGAWDASRLFPYTEHHWCDDVIPNYFDPNDFKTPVPSHDEREDFILFIGRIMKTKGLEEAMRLAAHFDMPLKVAGQGDFKKAMGWDPYPCVELLGTVDVDERRDLIARARVGICASLYLEPFCGVHIEMGLGGLPVLTTDVGVFTETVVDGRNGWRCKEFNDFVIGLENIRDIDPQVCHEMAMDYQIDRVVLRYQEYFERIHAAVSASSFWYLRPEKKDLDLHKRYLPQEVVQEKLEALKTIKTPLGDTYHPGGSIVGGDPYLIEPDVWDYCVDTLGAKTVLDIGAGEGHASAYFASKGCYVVAVDNDENAINNSAYPIVRHDFTTGAFVGGQFDMVYMAEFVEHLPEECLPHLAETLCGKNLILMTYAVPGQGGVGHVNLQEEPYWVQWMAHQGFDFDHETTYAVRAKAKHVHFKDRGLVFRHRVRHADPMYVYDKDGKAIGIKGNIGS